MPTSKNWSQRLAKWTCLFLVVFDVSRSCIDDSNKFSANINIFPSKLYSFSCSKSRVVMVLIIGLNHFMG